MIVNKSAPFSSDRRLNNVNTMPQTDDMPNIVSIDTLIEPSCLRIGSGLDMLKKNATRNDSNSSNDKCSDRKRSHSNSSNDKCSDRKRSHSNSSNCGFQSMNATKDMPDFAEQTFIYATVNDAITEHLKRFATTHAMSASNSVRKIALRLAAMLGIVSATYPHSRPNYTHPPSR